MIRTPDIREKVGEIKDILTSELKEGMTLYKYPINEEIQPANMHTYELEFTISQQFTLTTKDNTRYNLKYLIKKAELAIVHYIRSTTFNFKPLNHNKKILGLKIKTTPDCPQEKCIIHPKTFADLVSKYKLHTIDKKYQIFSTFPKEPPLNPQS